MAGIQQSRQDERREQSLVAIRKQVAAGTLVIRQMTEAERTRYPPVAPRADGRRAKRR
jgi:hypothetical protein